MCVGGGGGGGGGEGVRKGNNCQKIFPFCKWVNIKGKKNAPKGVPSAFLQGANCYDFLFPHKTSLQKGDKI